MAPVGTLIKLFKKNRSKESETVWMLLWKYAELVYVPNTDQKQYARTQEGRVQRNTRHRLI